MHGDEYSVKAIAAIVTTIAVCRAVGKKVKQEGSHWLDRCSKGKTRGEMRYLEDVHICFT
eukprot:1716401-Prorocentrum_lima.AAC.1